MTDCIFKMRNRLETFLLENKHWEEVSDRWMSMFHSVDDVIHIFPKSDTVMCLNNQAHNHIFE